MALHRKGHLTEGQLLKAQLTELVDEIDSQLYCLMKIAQAANDTGSKVFSLHTHNDGVAIAGGLLSNAITYDVHAAMETLRLAKQKLEDYGRAL